MMVLRVHLAPTNLHIIRTKSYISILYASVYNQFKVLDLLSDYPIQHGAI